MSRVHDALRKAAPEKPQAAPPPPSQSQSSSSNTIRAAVSQALSADADVAGSGITQPVRSNVEVPSVASESYYSSAATAIAEPDLERLEDIIRHAKVIPFEPAPDVLLVQPSKPKEAPSEEFRSLRTRLNHLQRSSNLHTLVVTSASPNEGKSFTACNLAICQAQLSGKRILLADFDFRRPSIAKTFSIASAPGITDYLRGTARLQDLIHRVADSNLYVITAGESVSNPLELLNLGQCASLLEGLRDHFDWVILDSPPLLFAADGNLLATMTDGTILVVRIGATTYDSVARAMQSLCENNVLGIVVNGAHRGELYSKYSYYHNYYYETDNKTESGSAPAVSPEPESVTVEGS